MGGVSVCLFGYRNNLMGGELMMLEGMVIVGGTRKGKKVSFLVEDFTFGFHRAQRKLIVTQMLPHTYKSSFNSEKTYDIFSIRCDTKFSSNKWSLGGF